MGSLNEAKGQPGCKPRAGPSSLAQRAERASDFFYPEKPMPNSSMNTKASGTRTLPVILARDEWPRWLGETPASDDELKAMLRPYEGEDLQLWPVSKRVGSVKNNDAFAV